MGLSLALSSDGLDSTDITRSYEKLNSHGNWFLNVYFIVLPVGKRVRGASEWCSIIDKNLNLNTGTTKLLNVNVFYEKILLFRLQIMSVAI